MNTAGNRQLTDRSIHVVGRIFSEDILGGDKRVSRGRSLGYLLSVRHLHRQRQNFIAVTVDAMRHRTQLPGLSPSRNWGLPHLLEFRTATEGPRSKSCCGAANQLGNRSFRARSLYYSYAIPKTRQRNRCSQDRTATGFCRPSTPSRTRHGNDRAGAGQWP